MAQNAPSEVQKFWDSNMVATTAWKTAVKGKLQLDAAEYQQHYAALSKSDKTATIVCPCDGCDQHSRRKVDAVRHLAGAHCAWYRGFKCTQCGTACKTGVHLESHINNKHANLRRYSCPVRGCAEAFKDDGALSAHKRKAHSAAQLAADDKPKNARSTAARERRDKKAKSRSKSPKLTAAAQAAPQKALPAYELQSLTAPQPAFWPTGQESAPRQIPQISTSLESMLDPLRSYLVETHETFLPEAQGEYQAASTVAPQDLLLRVDGAPSDGEVQQELSPWMDPEELLWFGEQLDGEPQHLGVAFPLGAEEQIESFWGFDDGSQQHFHLLSPEEMQLDLEAYMSQV